MNLSTLFIDKIAISISGLCVAHCLIFPIMAVLVPSFSALGLTSESFHFWMVVSVIPSSIYALTLGCKKHKNLSVIVLGASGLSGLLLAITLGHNLFGEAAEKILTIVGASLIAIAHVRNFSLCQQHDVCDPNSKRC